METHHKEIIDHIKRLEGQLRTVRTELERTEPDCIKAAQTLLSSARSFAGLREVFVTTFLRERIFRGAKVTDESTFASLVALIKG